MSIVQFEPRSLFDELNRFFEKSTRLPMSQDASSIDTSSWMPSVDIKEDKEQNRFVIKADLPGVEKKDISISMEDNTLTIRGHRHEDIKEEKDNYYRVERHTGDFYRRFVLPDSVDRDNIDASTKQGVLEVVIPKRTEKKSSFIDIQERD